MIATGWKNKRGTDGRKCKCGSWKQHWINYSNRNWPEKCSIVDCNNKAEEGAHIYNSKVSGEYIVPACCSCNNPNNEDEFELKPGTKLVSANKSETCEK